MKKIFSWFLSNLLLILVVIAVIYSYMFWGNLTGSDTPAGKAVAYLSKEFDGVGQFVEGVKTKQAKLSGQQSTTETDTVMSDAVDMQVDKTAEPKVVDDKAIEDKAMAVSLKQIPEDDMLNAEINLDSVTATGSEVAVQLANEAVSAEQSDQAATKAVTEERASVERSQDAESQKDESQQASELVLVEPQPVSISYNHNNMQVQQNSEGEVETRPQLPMQSQLQSEMQSQTQPQMQSLNGKAENVTMQKTETALVDSQKNNSLDNAKTSQDVTEAVAEVVAVAESANDTSDKQNGSNDDISKAKISSDGFVPVEIAEQLESVKESDDIVNNLSVDKSDLAAESMISIQEIWATARKSFYQKNYALSEQSYQTVIAETENNFDAYGELGNVYFNQGKHAQASEAYLNAATILLQNGDVQRAQSLLQVLQHLDPAKAKQLQQLIDASLS